MTYKTDKEVNEEVDNLELCECEFNNGVLIADVVKSFISQQRKEDLESIKKALIEQAEPYDNAKWHNTLSIETISKVLDSLSNNT